MLTVYGLRPVATRGLRRRGLVGPRPAGLDMIGEPAQGRRLQHPCRRSLEPVTTPGVRRIEGVAHPELFGGRALCYTALHRLTQTRG